LFRVWKLPKKENFLRESYEKVKTDLNIFNKNNNNTKVEAKLFFCEFLREPDCIPKKIIPKNFLIQCIFYAKKIIRENFYQETFLIYFK